MLCTIPPTANMWIPIADKGGEGVVKHRGSLVCVHLKLTLQSELSSLKPRLHRSPNGPIFSLYYAGSKQFLLWVVTRA